MPIDIKWVRNYADQVEEWQAQRQLTPRHHDSSLVSTVKQLDEECRLVLHQMRAMRQNVNQRSQQLRSTDQTPEERLALLQERKDLQVHLATLEEEHTQKQILLQRAWWKLGSPIDHKIFELYRRYDDQGDADDDALMTTIDLSKNMGFRFSQAIQSAALSYFGSKYSQIHSLNTHDMKVSSSPSSQEEQDLLHAMWGCTASTRSTDHDPDEEAYASCGICAASSWNPPQQPASTTTTARICSTPPPAWISFLVPNIPKKSIWGAKQLPQFTLLQSTNRLELVGLTAGTTWDARQVQLSIAKELQEWYQSMLAADAPVVELGALATTQLSLHEHSRIVLTTTTTGHDKIVLGQVSNFGDAAARACDWIFKGGGRHDVKEHVYVVHASMLSPRTIQRIIYANTKIMTTTTPTPGPRGSLVQIPPTLQRFGFVLPSMEDGVPLESFLTNKKKGKKPTPLLAMPSMDKPKKLLKEDAAARNHVRARLLDAKAFPGLPTKQPEALACPFGFLLA